MSITCPKCGKGTMIFYDIEDEEFVEPKYYCNYCNYTTKNPDAPYRIKKKKKGGRKHMAKTRWNIHLMKVYKELKQKNPNTKLKDAMKVAKKSYQK